jgi:hypothetical protein
MKVLQWVQLEEMPLVVRMGLTTVLNWGLQLERLVPLCSMDNNGS